MENSYRDRNYDPSGKIKLIQKMSQIRRRIGETPEQNQKYVDRVYKMKMVFRDSYMGGGSKKMVIQERKYNRNILS